MSEFERERLPSLAKEVVRRCRANPWKPSADTDSIESRIREKEFKRALLKKLILHLVQVEAAFGFLGHIL
ncbi:hypothetical protein BCR43DRAFT_481219 [Syncephalastrum racemosum]|uniref:Uncharacterized protein n=1 Tax=Syncephalastrum racemosum TaxID=13706 RepID=A0A1X2HRM6_SYNRA|nr:hypothetical protein BCR43DRAFT_481219 [Syncephalastrum racemosum]